ncbi:MAG: hypothetical protein FWF68_04300 [Spirochaetes bacterium]|nr:hypothetical protein [Spirochaetota bacterium]
METEKKLTHKFLVLVPHRDIRVELQKNCDSALKAQLADVYTFPRVTPLASLSQALEDGELKQIARSLRTHIGKNKIFAQENAVTDFPCYKKNVYLCGPRLDIDTHQDFFKNISKKIKYIFPSFVIGCFLKSEDNTKLDIFCETSQKKLEFRAAAVANMYWKALKINGEICYKWKIGKLCWLPHP